MGPVYYHYDAFPPKNLDWEGVVMSKATPGTVYLVYGASGRFSGTIDLATANLKLHTESISNPRPSLSGAGDVNGDGYDDFLVGDRCQGSGGTVYLFYGPPLGQN